VLLKFGLFVFLTILLALVLPYRILRLTWRIWRGAPTRRLTYALGKRAIWQMLTEVRQLWREVVRG